VESIVAEALEVTETEPRRTLDLVARAEARGLSEAGDHIRGLAGLARGRAAKHLGDQHQAEVSLAESMELLSGSGDADSWGRAAVSLASARVDAGRLSEALDLLDQVAPHLTGFSLARAALQRALAEYRIGHIVESIGSWDQCEALCGEMGLVVEQAVARQNRGIVQVYRGDLDAAESDLRAAGDTFAAEGHGIRHLEVVHNLGFVAARRGDLPRALELFDRAQEMASHLGVIRPQALIDRVEVNLDAGLVSEARSLAEAAVKLLERAGLDAYVPEGCLLAARACEQDGDDQGAARWAASALSLFEAQHRHRWRLLALHAALKAETAHPPRSVGNADRLFELADELRQQFWFVEAIEAEVRGVEILIECGEYELAKAVVGRLTKGIYRASPLGRFQVRLAEARLAVATGDRSRGTRALMSALRAFRAFQSTLGSIELRSRAGGRADDLMTLAVGLSRRFEDPDSALWWMESIRSTQRNDVLAQPSDPELIALLVSLREVTESLGLESVGVEDATRLRRRQAGLEELIRRRSRHTPGQGSLRASTADRDALVAALGSKVLLEFAVVDGYLVAVVLQGGVARLVTLGDLNSIRRIVGGLRLTLRVTTSGAGPDGRHQALIDAVNTADSLLVEPLALSDATDVVIVPVGPLASLPWASLPGLAHANLTLAASARAWIDSHSRYRAADRKSRVVLVAGPDLHHADEEVEAISRIWGNAVTLSGDQATADAVIQAIGNADVVHIAAHGTHRGDNPLLSGIRLKDGNLTGYELATARKEVQLVVLSCCDTGMAETSSGIGLARVLTTTGVNSAIASVTPVGDQSAVSLMTELHVRLADRTDPSSALSSARRAVGGSSGVLSSAGFVCYGYG
jgi:tetratricopeptide (TPR) repeat protein